MPLPLAPLRRFLRGTDGAITVEYVVLAAGITGLSIGAYGAVTDGLGALAGTVEGEINGTASDGTVGKTYIEGFRSGADGWSGAEATDMMGIGEVLGPIGGSGGAPTVSRDFVTDPDAAKATFQFDLYAMDSLDRESGVIYIDGKEVGRVTRNHLKGTTFTPAEGLAERGIIVRAEIVDDDIQLGGSTSWRDALSVISISVKDPGDTVNFGFGSTADQGVGDESFAIDNFVATGLRDL
ncbi:Flp family type IVb pilin [Jannaschia rubra]|uniref:Flp pilus assembly protein, pilin Flp n=1 Tax=Jannaschia rubra TaxID=282197 RepID=A0A0M6XM71_9RHOB|nr:hypothetical protein [Jannaschia rubra]CTQ32028.1 hypothetical protein JAN5088_00787 [Jannaschia rubra]SFG39449.1 hypothetical protein SAMN04488517_104207 [Jannaschia rubra]